MKKSSFQICLLIIMAIVCGFDRTVACRAAPPPQQMSRIKLQKCPAKKFPVRKKTSAGVIPTDELTLCKRQSEMILNFVYKVTIFRLDLSIVIYRKVFLEQTTAEKIPIEETKNINAKIPGLKNLQRRKYDDIK